MSAEGDTISIFSCAASAPIEDFLAKFVVTRNQRRFFRELGQTYVDSIQTAREDDRHVCPARSSGNFASGSEGAAVICGRGISLDFRAAEVNFVTEAVAARDHRRARGNTVQGKATGVATRKFYPSALVVLAVTDAGAADDLALPSELQYATIWRFPIRANIKDPVAHAVPTRNDRRIVREHATVHGDSA
jgi:hypothetical protein